MKEGWGGGDESGWLSIVQGVCVGPELFLFVERVEWVERGGGGGGGGGGGVGGLWVGGGGGGGVGWGFIWCGGGGGGGGAPTHTG